MREGFGSATEIYARNSAASQYILRVCLISQCKVCDRKEVSPTPLMCARWSATDGTRATCDGGKSGQDVTTTRLRSAA